MAETRIPGRHGDTLHSDSYGLSVNVGPTEPAEDPTKWVIRKFTDADLQKRFLWTSEQLQIARAFLGFPQGEQVISTGWWPKTTIQTHEQHIVKWEEHARACGLLK